MNYTSSKPSPKGEGYTVDLLTIVGSYNTNYHFEQSVKSIRKLQPFEESIVSIIPLHWRGGEQGETGWFYMPRKH